MKPGSLTYHDWTELVLTQVPRRVGRRPKLLPTSRGRGRESAVVGAFRKTPFPSSERPEPVYLTWSEDPRTTQTMQWRTNVKVSDGIARVSRRKVQKASFRDVPASVRTMDDRMLANDRVCRWYTAVARGPQAGYDLRIPRGQPAVGCLERRGRVHHRAERRQNRTDSSSAPTLTATRIGALCWRRPTSVVPMRRSASSRATWCGRAPSGTIGTNSSPSASRCSARAQS